MKKLILIAATLVATGAALAQTAATPAAKPLSREQVIAELARARASGELEAMRSEDTATFGTPLRGTRQLMLAEAEAKKAKVEKTKTE